MAPEVQPTNHENQANLLAGLEALQPLLGDLAVGIMILDAKDHSVLFYNRKAAKHLGDKAGGSYHDIVTLLFAGVDNGDLSAIQGECQKVPLGTQMLGVTVYGASDRFFWLFFKDLTQSLRNRDLEKASSAVNDIDMIFSGIENEMGNPVNAIKLTLAILREKLPNFGPDKISDYVHRALLELSKMEYLLKSLQHYTLFGKPIIKPLDIKRFTKSFFGMVHGVLRKKNIRLKVDLKVDYVMADPRALEEILLHLFSNAEDALAKVSEPTITFSTEKVGDQVHLSFCDNGPGVPRAHRSFLFTPFFTTKPNGKGLGLVLSKKLALAMSGLIDLQFPESGGTRVTISLPYGEPS